MEPIIANNYVQYKTTKGLWKGFATTYSVGRDSAQIFELTVQANSLKQGQEIDENQSNPMEYEIDIYTYNRIQSETWLFQLLAGVSEKYEPERLNVLKMGPLPTSSPSKNRGSSSWEKIEKSKLKCSYGAMMKHTTEMCFQLVGYPEWWEDNHKPLRDGRGKATLTVSDPEITGTIDSRGDGSHGGGRCGTGEGSGKIATAARVSSESERGVRCEESEKGVDFEGTGLGILIPDPLLSHSFHTPGRGRLLDVAVSTVDCTTWMRLLKKVMLATGTATHVAWLWHRCLGGQGESTKFDPLSWLPSPSSPVDVVSTETVNCATETILETFVQSPELGEPDHALLNLIPEECDYIEPSVSVIPELTNREMPEPTKQDTGNYVLPP
ncbi:hypothetical protein C2S52_009111 [Perilla frutescens var. hirtella]|nr:hypothetical protein C2S52_009111 [Perilla frutescens var. hirtella]